MDELLTAKQVQELLKVDRTTIYRMLGDKRITGVKVGQQWRFHSSEIDALIKDGAQRNRPLPLSGEILPLHCLEPIQNVFAEIAQVASVTLSPEGVPLLQLSNSCRYCSLILASESGREACAESWRLLAEKSGDRRGFRSCHAGLLYACSRVEVNGNLVAIFAAGQFYSQPPEPDEKAARITRLAHAHNIDEEDLTSAAHDLRQLDDIRRLRINGWLEAVARTFAQVAAERAQLMARLDRIAEMSTLRKGEALPSR